MSFGMAFSMMSAALAAWVEGEPIAAAVEDLELVDEEGGYGRVGGAALGEVRPF
jgi:hypothetical protein